MADEPNPKYDQQSTYNKYSESCDENGRDCVCCPVGTVAVTNDCGEIIGCLTPNDAEHFNASRLECAEGYVKLLHPLTGEFMGCVTPEDAQSILAQLSPDIDPVVTDPALEQFNIVTDPVAINGASGGAFTENVDAEIDRIELSDPVVVQMGTVNPPPSGVTIVGSPLVIPSGDSTITIPVSIGATVAAGTYNFDIAFIGGGVTKILQVTLTLT